MKRRELQFWERAKLMHGFLLNLSFSSCPTFVEFNYCCYLAFNCFIGNSFALCSSLAIQLKGPTFYKIRPNQSKKGTRFNFPSRSELKINRRVDYFLFCQKKINYSCSFQMTGCLIISNEKNSILARKSNFSFCFSSCRKDCFRT